MGIFVCFSSKRDTRIFSSGRAGKWSGFVAIALFLAFTSESAAPPDCSDGIDNDLDGYTDEVDLGCLKGRESKTDGCNPRPDPENLIYNGHLECSSVNGVPDGWSRRGETSVLDWGPSENPSVPWNSNLFTSASTIAGSNTSYWRLDDFPTGTETRLSLEPDTWYLFSLDLGSDGITAFINPNNQDQMERNSFWNGAQVDIRTENSDVRFEQVELTSRGTAMADFDPVAGAYRTVAPGGAEPIRRVTHYFRTGHWDPGTEGLIGEVRSYQYSSGNLYLDNFSLRKLDTTEDPDAPIPANQGTLVFMQKDGADIFPIVLWGGVKDFSGDPIRPNEPEWSTLIGTGFNTHGYSAINQSGQIAVLNDWPDGLGLVFGFANPYWLSSTSVWWRNDPDHLLPWIGPSRNQEFYNRIQQPENQTARNNLTMALAQDEVNCHPAETGSPQTHLGMIEFARDNFHAIFPNVPVYQNFCGGNITGFEEDLALYLAHTDAFTRTANLGAAYPGNLTTRKIWLDLVGGKTRRSIEISSRTTPDGDPLPHLAFGLGVREWSRWDGNNVTDPVIPFHLQRFLIYTQIINGATGAWFHLSSWMDLADPYDALFFDQMRHIAEELAVLEPVLLVPDYTRATVSDARVMTMIKEFGSKRYLFAASNSPKDLFDIEITVPNPKPRRVTALGDVVNGEFANAFDRLVCSRRCRSFTDHFTGEDDSSPQGVETPGYAVHIYELDP